MDIKKVYTDNLYEASYYMIKGAQFVEAEESPVEKSKLIKTGYKTKWSVYLINVPEEAIEEYKNGTAEVNLNDIENKRTRLKFLIKRCLFRKKQIQRGKKWGKHKYDNIVVIAQ